MIINGRKIGPGQPPYVIAEISGNHEGSYEKAAHLMGLAAWAGADAVKIQCYTADSLTIDCDKPDFVIKNGPWQGRSLHKLYRKTQTPPDLVTGIFHLAKQYGQTVFSSVFDEDGLDLLESLGCPAYKIASMEIVDLPLIRAVVKTGKPIIISTGMATYDEVNEATWAALQVPHAVLHCVSGYPTQPENFNLMRMPKLGCKIYGISDHTLGSTIPVAAVALGANIIEKHICVSRQDDTEDSAFSLEPEEFKQMCEAVRATWMALREPKSTSAEDSSRQLRRSLYVVEDVKKGERFTSENIRSIRPSYGLPPRELPDVLGMVASQDIERGTPLTAYLITRP